MVTGLKSLAVALAMLLSSGHALAQVSRGEYLVQGLGHCGACHTPRGLFQQPLDDQALQGGEVNGWQAPPLTGPALQGWSDDALVQYLSTGQTAGQARAAGPMAEVIEHSLSRLDRDDLTAIARYLKQLPGPPSQPAPTLAPNALGGQTSVLFERWCASCHAYGGRGLPALDDPGLLARRAGPNLLPVLREGIERNGEVRMPGFSGVLSEQELATLATGLSIAPRAATPVAPAWLLYGALVAALAIAGVTWRRVNGI